MPHPSEEFDHPDIVALGPVAVALWACMLQGPHTRVNVPGLWEVSPEALFSQLGGRQMTPQHQLEVENAFEGIVAAGLAIYDRYSGLLRLPEIWRKYYTPTVNQVFGWKNAWDSYRDTPFRFKHLPTLRRIAEKSADALDAFDARFGLIQVLNPRTYALGDNWKKGQALPEGIRVWDEPTDLDLRYKKIDYLFFSKRVSREDLVLNLDLDLDLVLGHRDAIGMGSNEGRATNEGGDGNGARIDDGIGTDSRRRRDDIGMEPIMHREGIALPSVSRNGGVTPNERRRDPGNSDRPIPGQSGPAPRREPTSAPSGDTSPPLGVGGGTVLEGAGGGGWADVVELPVPDGRPGTRKRQ